MSEKNKNIQEEQEKNFKKPDKDSPVNLISNEDGILRIGIKGRIDTTYTVFFYL